MRNFFIIIVIFTIILFTIQNVNAQKNCENKKYVSVGTFFREKTEYFPIIQSTQTNSEYKITLKSYDAEQGSIYCDVKFTNLEGVEEEWKGTGDWGTIKPKAGTTLYIRFSNSTTMQGVLVEYEICKRTEETQQSNSISEKEDDTSTNMHFLATQKVCFDSEYTIRTYEFYTDGTFIDFHTLTKFDNPMITKSAKASNYKGTYKLNNNSEIVMYYSTPAETLQRGTIIWDNNKYFVVSITIDGSILERNKCK